MEKTFFEIALEYFGNEHEDVYFDFEHVFEKGKHTVTVSFDGDVMTYEFDEDVVDELNDYLGSLYRANEPLYDDVTDFLFDAFFEGLEEVIEEENMSFIEWEQFNVEA